MDKSTTARSALTDTLLASGAVTTKAVEAAVREVPRHLFLLDVPSQQAYADRAVTIKYNRAGIPISSASQPTMVAQMLEQLDVREGDHALEIGTATGYNAALLAFLVGEAGRVVSVEIEDDLAARAEESLGATGFAQVRVVRGDGRTGYLPGAPYDRIIITAGVQEVAPAWLDQLAEGGRLVVPLVNLTGDGMSVLFEMIDGEPVARSGRPCGFVPLRTAPG